MVLAQAQGNDLALQAREAAAALQLARLLLRWYQSVMVQRHQAAMRALQRQLPFACALCRRSGAAQAPVTSRPLQL